MFWPKPAPESRCSDIRQVFPGHHTNRSSFSEAVHFRSTQQLNVNHSLSTISLQLCKLLLWSWSELKSSGCPGWSSPQAKPRHCNTSHTSLCGSTKYLHTRLASLTLPSSNSWPMSLDNAFRSSSSSKQPSSDVGRLSTFKCVWSSRMAILEKEYSLRRLSKASGPVAGVNRLCRSRAVVRTIRRMRHSHWCFSNSAKRSSAGGPCWQSQWAAKASKRHRSCTWRSSVSLCTGSCKTNKIIHHQLTWEIVFKNEEKRET